MLKISKWKRVLIYILVFILSIIFSSIHYYYFKIDKFNLTIQEIIKDIWWKKIIYNQKGESKVLELTPSGFLTFFVPPLTWNTFLLSSINWKRLRNYWSNYLSLSNWQESDILNLTSYLIDLKLINSITTFFRISPPDKDKCYKIQLDRIYLYQNKIYLSNKEEKKLILLYHKNSKGLWIYQGKKELNKIRIKLFNIKTRNLPYYYNYNLCENFYNLN